VTTKGRGSPRPFFRRQSYNEMVDRPVCAIRAAREYLHMHTKSLLRLAALTSKEFLATPSRRHPRRYVRPAAAATTPRERRKAFRPLP